MSVGTNIFTEIKQADESRDGRYLRFHPELIFALQMQFAGFSKLPVDLNLSGAEPSIYQHKFLVNPDQTLAYGKVEAIPQSIKEKMFLDRVNSFITLYRLPETESSKISIQNLAEKFDSLTTENLETNQKGVNRRQEISLYVLLRILFQENRKKLLNNNDRLWVLHIQVLHKRNTRDEIRHVMDMTISKEGEETSKILEKMERNNNKYSTRKMDEVNIYIHYTPSGQPWFDIEDSAFFRFYLNEFTFADILKQEITNEISKKILDASIKKGIIKNLKEKMKNLAGDDVANLDNNHKVPTAFVRRKFIERKENFVSILEKHELSKEQQQQIIGEIEAAHEYTKKSFRNMVAANMPGYNIEFDDDTANSKINEFTCKIMAGAGRIELSKVKGTSFKYQIKDNNALIQGYSCSRHTAHEVEAIYDFVISRGDDETLKDFLYVLALLDEGSCGRKNRAYWLKAVILGLQDAHLRNRHKYLFDVLADEYGKSRAKELMSLDPTFSDRAYDKVKTEMEKLAEVKFGPVKLKHIGKGIISLLKPF